MTVARTERLKTLRPRRLLPLAAALVLCVWCAASGRSLSVQVRGAQRAATLAEYRARVGQAVAPLEELASEFERVRASAKEEVWSQKGFSADFIDELPRKKEETLARVRALLPPREKVERGVGVAAVEVDNGWVHAALDALASETNYEEGASGLRALAGRLRALEAQLRGSDAAAASDRDAERGRLNSILQRPEFAREGRKQQGALERLVEDFLKWLLGILPRGGKLSPGGSPRVSQWTLVVVVGLCLLLLAYVARRVWRRRGRGRRALGLGRGPRVVLGERLEADRTAKDLLDEAEGLARAGELRGAIRKAYVALLCELGDRGVVRLAQHKTNRDYLDAVRRAAPPRLYTEMLPLTNAFELHWYGLRPASDADWQSFRTRCREVVKEVVSRQ